jgi:hypothetical protein
LFGRRRESSATVLAQYAALVSDLRDQVRERDEQIASLVDRVLALSSPASLREVRRTPPTPTPQVQESGKNQSARRHIHWPGHTPDLRPPPPRTPPVPAAKSPLTDMEKAVAMETVKRG